MIDLIGYIAGIFLTLSFLPQVVKTYRAKDARDVSMGMLLLMAASGVGYEIYSWMLELWPRSKSNWPGSNVLPLSTMPTSQESDWRIPKGR